MLFPPTLLSALKGQREARFWDGPPPDLERAETVEKGHGRIETRRIATTREVVPHLGWPGLAQVCRIERTREVVGKISCEVVYAVTSLSRERTGPAELLALARQHWAIENRLHWRRDVALHEDASRVRSRRRASGPRRSALYRAPPRSLSTRTARRHPGGLRRKPLRRHFPRSARLSLNAPGTFAPDAVEST